MGIIDTRIRSKKDTELNWSVNNPILLDGEIAIVIKEDDTTGLKVGDGTNNFNDLPYICDVNKEYVDILFEEIKNMSGNIISESGEITTASMEITLSTIPIEGMYYFIPPQLDTPWDTVYWGSGSFNERGTISRSEAVAQGEAVIIKYNGGYGNTGANAFDIVASFHDHNHENKEVLDGVTSNKVTEWDNNTTQLNIFFGSGGTPEYTTLREIADGIRSKASAEELSEVKKISNLAHVHFGVCSTAATEAAKTVEISNFILKNGVEVYVYFDNSHDIQSYPTLNVNGTGAFPIFIQSPQSGNSQICQSLKAGLYLLIYYNDAYYTYSGNLIPTHSIVYAPTTATYYSYRYGMADVSTSSSFTPDSDTILLPGTFNKTSTVNFSTISYMKGYNKIDRNSIISSNSYYSILSMNNLNNWGYIYTGDSLVFENIYFTLTTTLDYGILSTSETKKRKIRFVNCVFELDCSRAFLVQSGSIEFENCSFFINLSTSSSECVHIVEGISNSTISDYKVNISFKNCYIEGENSTDKHIYLAALSGYHTNLTIIDCYINNCDPYKVEASTTTSSATADCNIVIRNNHIITKIIGNYDTLGSGYVNGSFIFTENIFDLKNAKNFGGNMFVVHGGNKSIISNNTIISSSSVSIKYHALSPSMVNSFVGNTIDKDTLLSRFSSSYACYIVATGNAIAGKLSSSGFTSYVINNNFTKS